MLSVWSLERKWVEFDSCSFLNTLGNVISKMAAFWWRFPRWRCFLWRFPRWRYFDDVASRHCDVMPVPDDRWLLRGRWLYGSMRLHMVPYRSTWFHMDPYGLTWFCMENLFTYGLHGSMWLYVFMWFVRFHVVPCVQHGSTCLSLFYTDITGL